jgi:hypothetical protein
MAFCIANIFIHTNFEQIKILVYQGIVEVLVLMLQQQDF